MDSQGMRRPRRRRGAVAPAVAGLAIIALLIATGCGSDDDGATAAGGGGSAGGGKTVGTPEDFVGMSEICGDEPITVALADGYGANSWRKIARAEFEAEAAKCPQVEKVIYTDAQGSPQKAISDVNGLVSQGADAIVLMPDSGPAMLPATRAAMRAGVKVAIVPADLGGKIGQDYVTAVYDSPEENGRVWAEWMVKALKGKGNVVFLGGTPGNPTSPAEAKGIKEVFAKNAGMKLLAGPVDTNWDVAQTQKAMAGLLTKFPKIDGVISDYGGGTVGAIRAFEAAGRPLVPIATNDFNQLGCLWKKYKDKGQEFPLATVSARTWMVRPALRHAAAAAWDKPDPEPSIVELPLLEDSTSSDPDVAVQCNPELPPDAILSSQLGEQGLVKLFGQ